MKPLTRNQEMLEWISIMPADENASRRERFLHIASTIALISIETCMFISSLVFFLKNVSTDLEESLYALLQLIAVFAQIYMMVSGLIIRRKVVAMFQTLSEIYDENETQNSYRFLAWANGKSEWLWKIYIKFIIKGFVVNTIISIAFPLVFCLINGEFNTDVLYHAYRTVVPWNGETPLGYFFESCFHLIFAETNLFVHGVFMLPFISLCLYHRAFNETFQYSLRDFDGNEIMKVFLRDLIRFRVSIQEFFVESAKVYSPFIMIQLFCCMLILACCVFQLDLLLKHFGPDISLISAAIMFNAATLFIYCYFAKSATDNFTKMADSLYGINWYEIPVDSQKYFILMIQNMEKPLYYHGFGVVVLNLETFTKLMRAVMTYYMMFKTITSK